MIDEKPKTHTATRPASRWRNRFLTLRPFVHWDVPISRETGEVWIGSLEWPSRDTAETHGQEKEAISPTIIKYLGAFPVDA